MLRLGLESLTKKWWFYLLVFLVVLFIPSYTEKPVAYTDIGELVITVLKEALIPYRWLAPIFHIATIIFMVLLWKFNKNVGRYFYAYLAGNYIFMALAQNITTTEEHGFVIISSNLLLILLAGVLWLCAVIEYKEDFQPQKVRKWQFWAVPLVILAFWFPTNELGQPDFNPMLLLTSDFGLAFCLTTPVMIFILTLFYPHIYKPAYRALCAVGIYFGLFNLIGPLMIPGYTVWLAILHIPLFTISIYGLMLGKLRK